MDNFLVVKEVQIVFLQDYWLITQSKATPKIKVYVKKAAEWEKKLVEKQNKAQNKPRPKTKTNF